MMNGRWKRNWKLTLIGFEMSLGHQVLDCLDHSSPAVVKTNGCICGRRTQKLESKSTRCRHLGMVFCISVFFRWNSKLLHSFPDVIYHLSWSLLGNVLAVSSGDNTVTLWKEMANGEWQCVADDVGKAGATNSAPHGESHQQPPQQQQQQQHQ